MSPVCLVALVAWGQIAAENVLRIEHATVAPGDERAVLRILVDNDDFVMGLSFGAIYDEGLGFGGLTIEGTELGPEGLAAEYFEVFEGSDAEHGVFFGAAAIFDAAAPFDWRKLPPGADQAVAAVHFDVAQGLPHRTTLSVTPLPVLADADGGPAVATVLTVAGEGQVPRLVAGGVTVLASGTGLVLMRESQEWRFLKGTAPPPEEWTAPDFDPVSAGWDAGPGPIGYEHGEDPAVLATVLDDMDGGYLSVFLRTDFEVPAGHEDWIGFLKVRYDDGFVAYLDGIEIARRNIEGEPPGFDAAAAGNHDVVNPYGFDETIAIDSVPGFFAPGMHVLAVQAHNATLTSSDFSFAAQLELAPFVIESVEPAFGAMAGGNSVTIKGMGFSAAAPPVVFFGDVRSPDAAVAGPEALVAIVPPGAARGAVAVEVADARGVQALADAYRYVGPRQAGLRFGGQQAAGVENLGIFSDGAVFEGWFRRSGTGIRWTTLCALEGAPGTEAVRIDTRWNRVRAATAGAETDLTADVTMDTVWHHAAVSVSPAGRRIILDGIEVAADGQSVVLPASGAFRLGAGFGDTSRFTGDIESFRVWNTVRPPVELARERFALPEGLSELAGAWHLKDAGGDLAEDKGPRGTALVLGALAGSDAEDPAWAWFEDFPEIAITAIEPDHGPRAGVVVVAVYGTGFAPGAAPAVAFGATASPQVEVESPWKLQAAVPAHDVHESVDVTVTAEAGTAVAAAGYTYRPDAVYAFVREGDPWDYFVAETPPDAGWRDPTFDPAAAGWLRGPSGLGYGDGDDATDLAWMAGRAVTLYARVAWQLPSAGAAIDYLALRIRYDDGFVAYLNGQEIARRAVAGAPPAFDEPASELHEILGGAGTFDERIDVGGAIRFLAPGMNVLAIETHNESIDSTDLSMSAELDYSAPGATFVRGDVNGDGVLTVSDAIVILRVLFAGRELACLEAADAADDGVLNVADAIALLGFLFTGGAAPPPPAPGSPMPDIDGDALDCAGATAARR